jgi:hypothetical protein
MILRFQRTLHKSIVSKPGVFFAGYANSAVVEAIVYEYSFEFLPHQVT